MKISQQDIVHLVEKMPAFPKTVHRVIELTSDMNCNPKDLVELIEHDPVMVMNILRLVNSAYFGLAQPITSVNHAVVYIGLNTVKNVALSTATIGVLPKRNEAGFDMEAFLLHSLSTATIARMMAKRMKVPSKDLFDYFLAGLMHDFGKIVFANFMPHEFKIALKIAKENSIHLYEAENEIFDINHAQVGSLLGEKWQLPQSLVDSLKCHHSHKEGKSQIIDVVSAADQITKELKFGYSGENLLEALPAIITKQFGKDINAIVTDLGDVNTEIDNARIFISS
ncbi:MAG: HDOD domain-containing protein [Nitrospirae bacterium]|nr:MAG: HDOD domain-containing protein [Nitrospirota bacterium]